MVIDSFRGDYYYLSNYYPVKVKYKGLIFKSSEAAFQASKCIFDKDREAFQYLTASESKLLGRKVSLRVDWERVKDQIMYEIVKSKFDQHIDIKIKLLETDDIKLIEGNTWNDIYWGVCNKKGLNKLGFILMKVRSDIRKEKDIKNINILKEINSYKLKDLIIK